MTTTSATTNPLAGTSGSLSSSLGTTTTASDQSTNFLKMLVAQMANQDPLNPMDNAQVTSQLAQISTVQGIETLNTTMTGLGTQFGQMQALQGVNLIGKDVATEGDNIRINSTTGKGDGGYELATAATDVKVTVTNSAGQTIQELDLGAQDSGRHDFSLDVPEVNQSQDLTFKVTAVNKSTDVDSMALQYNTVTASSTINGQLALELDNGQRVSYDAVWSFL